MMFKPAQSFRRPIWVLTVLFLSGNYLFAGDLKTLSGHVPKIVANLSPIGSVPATNQLRLAIGLPLHNTDALAAFMAQLYDPASPGYRQFLTQEEFTARFGPTAQDYEAVKNFARGSGLTIVGEFTNRLLLDVTGPAAAVEKAFHVTLRTYHHPTEARDFFAPDTEPTVDVSLPVVDVQGLSDFSKPHPKFARKAAVARPESGTAPDKSGDYFGKDFRVAYASGVALTGTGQSVALFEADGYYATDIATYANAASNGSVNISVQTVTVDNAKAKVYSSDGNLECSLDIEMAMSIAPGLSRILVVEGNPNDYIPNDILNAMLSYSSTIKNLSCSWGWSGGPSSTTDSIFTNMAAVGQSFFDASGDSCAFTAGASSANGVDNPDLENAPSSCPIITQVGATTLTLNGSGASYSSEVVWNWGTEIGSQYDGVGSSGGISSYYAIPSYQAGVPNLISAGGSTGFRNIPDVAANGDNVVVYAGSNHIYDDIGGTSCAAPLWAGFTALVNQQAAANGLASVGFLNPALYNIGNGPNYNACFHDVTSGNNTWSSSPDLFYAQTGYDLCTGFGSPNGIALVNALAGVQGLAVSPLTGSASGPGGGLFTISSGSFALTNSTSSALNWSLINTSSWLNFSATSGTLSANGHATITASLNAAANSLVTGTYTANLVFSNATAQSSQAGVFTLQISQPLTVSPSKSFAASGPVSGPFNVTSQSYALTNLSGASLSWTVLNAPSWLNVSPSAGTLSAGGQTSFTASLNALASGLAAGVYTNTLLVTNAFGLAAALPLSLSVGQPILTNGGFETGNFNGWTLNADTADDLVTSSSAYVHSGSYGAELGQPNTLGYLSQTLSTLPGQAYVLSFWLDNPTSSEGATPNQFLVQWNGNTIFNESDIPFMGWTNLQFVVSASGTSTVLEFGFYDTPSYLGLDDVSVTPVSPPVFNFAQSADPAFNLTWAATPGVTYQLQYTTNLAQTNWINLGSPQTASGNTLNYSDTGALASSPARFYRVEIVP